MAKPRRKQTYTPALLENLRHRYEETDESVVDIGASIARSHTFVRSLAREHGWTRYEPPPLDLTPAAKLAAEAARLAAESRAAGHGAPSTLPPRSGGEGRFALREQGEPGWGDASTMEKPEAAEPPPPPTPDPSPPLAEPTGGGETDAAPVDLSNLAPDARMARLSEMARALDFQLALLRQKQAQPQRGEDTKAINAEVKNFAATCALIEHQLSDLARGRSTPLPNETHDDIPEDIDAFRLRLAANIEAFLQRRPDIGDGDADAADGHDPARL